MSVSNKVLPQTYLIAGDDRCQCVNWRDCQWSKAAVLSVKDLAKESDEFKQVQTILRQNTCGDDPENHFVNCCGPDQKPSEIDPFIHGMYYSSLFNFLSRNCLLVEKLFDFVPYT